MSEKMTTRQRRMKIRQFSWKIFQEGHPELNIHGVVVDKKDGEYRIVVLVGAGTNHDLLRKELNEHFGDHLYKIVEPDGAPEPTQGTFYSGSGVVREHSNDSGTVGGWLKMSKLRNGGAVDQTQWFGVSNNHVLALCGAGKYQDVITDTSPNRVPVGTLFDRYPLDKSSFDNTDIAVFAARKDLNLVWQREIPKGFTAPKINHEVCKNGAQVPHYTEGKITGIASMALPLCGQTYHFTDLVVIEGNSGPFSKAGDSGSFVCTMNGYIVGMLFYKWGDFAYAIPEKHLRNRMNLYLPQAQ